MSQQENKEEKKINAEKNLDVLCQEFVSEHVKNFRDMRTLQKAIANRFNKPRKWPARSRNENLRDLAMIHSFLGIVSGDRHAIILEEYLNGHRRNNIKAKLQDAMSINNELVENLKLVINACSGTNDDSLRNSDQHLEVLC